MIEVDRLSKSFYVHKKEPGFVGSVKSLFARQRVERRAVRSVSFRVGEGEIVGLVGANGAGKTTIVKMLAGVIHPSAGGAKVLGYTPWERDNRFRSQIALIMGQKAQLWWDLPAGDGFLLLKEIYRISEADYRARLDALSGLLGVREEMRIPVRRLSLGERMKMELIAALLHAPRVVYLDEPTIGLDLTAQRAVREFILQYRREHRPAMILTSHYMEDIERLCERLLILREGELVYDGSLKRVVETYGDRRVVTAHLAPGNGGVEAVLELERVGTVLSCTQESVRVEVPRASVAAAASLLLSRYSVADLAVESPDIGTIIERLIRKDVP